MLEIERKIKDNGIVIILPDGTEVRLYLLKTSRNKATIGFGKFQNVGIYRAELWEKIKNSENALDALPEKI